MFSIIRSLLDRLYMTARPSLQLDNFASTNIMRQSLVVKLLSPTAQVPHKAGGFEEVAGFDLYTDEECVLSMGKVSKIATNICVQIPTGYYGQIFERSSAALKGVSISGGVIDSDYRGPIFIICTNVSSTDITISKGMRIAQLVIIPIPQLDVKTTDYFDSDVINEHLGFGSTGLY